MTDEKKHDVAEVRHQIRVHARAKACALSRKERLGSLMERRTANGWWSAAGKARSGWDPAKKARMVRRYTVACQEFDAASSTLGDLEQRLDQLLNN